MSLYVFCLILEQTDREKEREREKNALIHLKF